MVRALVSLLVVLFAPLSVGAASAGVFNPETAKLANGMDVVVVPNHRAPVVHHMVWYRVGAADEVDGQTGIAHLLEHLMFKGTPKFPNGTFSKILARNGGDENAFTSYDFTAYHQTVAKDRLAMIMEMEADRMTNLLVNADDVITERNVVLEERRQRVGNSPQAALREQLISRLFVGSPYARPVIGSNDDLLSLTRDDLLAFYKKYYAPDNAVLVISGDVTLEEVLPLAEKFYGVIPSQGTTMGPRENPQSFTGEPLVIHDERVRQPTWQASYLAPTNVWGERRLAPALEIVEQILSGGATSRLYKALVVESGDAVGAGASYSAGGRGAGQFTLYASPKPGVSPDQVRAQLEAEIARFLKDGISQEELARAKTQMRVSSIYARDSLSAGAMALGQALSTGLHVDNVETWPKRIMIVTSEEVMEAARAVLSGTPSISSYLLPEAK